MDYLTNFRDQLGLSQTDFANLIDCTRGQLSMAECGLRGLTTASNLLMYQLEKAMTDALSTPVDNELDGKTTALLNKLIDDCDYNIRSMKRKAEQTGEKLAKSKRLLAVCQAFAGAPFLPDVGVVHLRMNILHRELPKKLERYTTENLRLQIAIAGVEAELAKGKELLDGLKK